MAEYPDPGGVPTPLFPCPEQGAARAAGQRRPAPSGSRFCNVSLQNLGGRCGTIKRLELMLQRLPGVQPLPLCGPDRWLNVCCDAVVVFRGSFDIAHMTTMGILHHRLHGRLWHTTRPDRFSAILASGCLTANPDIPNSERWKASRPEHYPFARCLGGISLFDFANFDPKGYEQTHPLSNWYDFVPYLRSWGGAVWIEVDRVSATEKLISATKLLALWDQDGNRGHAIMPRIEAAYIGDMPVATFRSAFITWDEGRELREIDPSQFNPTDFTLILREWSAVR
jgi:hypothetical protein